MATTKKMTAAAASKKLIADAKLAAKKILADAKTVAALTKASLPKTLTEAQKAQAVQDAAKFMAEMEAMAKAVVDQARADITPLDDVVPPVGKGYHFTRLKTPGDFQIKVGPGVLRRIIYHFPITHNPALVIIDGLDSNAVKMDVSGATGSGSASPGVLPVNAFPEEPSSYYVLNYHKAFTNGLRIETKEAMTITVVWE